MCEDSLPEDLTRSRTRWYDLPALLLYHRPIRCRMCDGRYFAVRGTRSISVLSVLWMHYAIVISLVCMGVGIYQYQQNQSGQPTKGVARHPAINTPAEPRE